MKLRVIKFKNIDTDGYRYFIEQRFLFIWWPVGKLKGFEKLSDAINALENLLEPIEVIYRKDNKS